MLPGYVDGELDLVRHLEVERHLQECPACTREVKGQQALRAVLCDPSFYRRPGAHLARRVRFALRREQRSPAGYAGLVRRMLPAAAAIPFIAVLAGLLYVWWSRPPAEDPLVQQVVSSHVRSLVAANPVDKRSSDRHQVKPWLTERLDFAVPVVKNLADQGYPLIGGRVDYVDNRKVAALVYQRRRHVINLFVWPTTDADRQPRSLTQRGYNLIHWISGGLNYWAISDLDESGLLDFVHLISK
jgi:anti-sigma factor RsiW